MILPQEAHDCAQSSSAQVKHIHTARGLGKAWPVSQCNCTHMCFCKPRAVSHSEIL